jgi:hypothetical protein
MNMAIEIIAQHGPMTGIEVNKLLGLPPYSVFRTDNVVVRACKDLVEDGRLVTRFETTAEQRVRHLAMGHSGGRAARLFAVDSKQLATVRDAPLELAAETESARPVTPITTPPGELSLRERMSDLANEAWAIHNELMRREPSAQELDDLRIMNGMLEEENDRLREEVAALRAKLAKIREDSTL